jgi:hypothetical protein
MESNKLENFTYVLGTLVFCVESRSPAGTFLFLVGLILVTRCLWPASLLLGRRHGIITSGCSNLALAPEPAAEAVVEDLGIQYRKPGGHHRFVFRCAVTLRRHLWHCSVGDNVRLSTRWRQ